MSYYLGDLKNLPQTSIFKVMINYQLTFVHVIFFFFFLLVSAIYYDHLSYYIQWMHSATVRKTTLGKKHGFDQKKRLAFARM